MSDTPNLDNGQLAPYEVPPADPQQQLQTALQSGAFLTGIDTEEREGKLQVAEILSGKGMPLEDWYNKEFEVINYLLTHARFVDEKSGEIVSTIVTRVIIAGGDWIETHSTGVLKTLGTFVQLFGEAPWAPPLICKLVRRQIRGGKSWACLELVRDKPAGQVGDKKGGKAK